MIEENNFGFRDKRGHFSGSKANYCLQYGVFLMIFFVHNAINIKDFIVTGCETSNINTGWLTINVASDIPTSICLLLVR